MPFARNRPYIPTTDVTLHVQQDHVLCCGLSLDMHDIHSLWVNMTTNVHPLGYTSVMYVLLTHTTELAIYNMRAMMAMLPSE